MEVLCAAMMLIQLALWLMALSISDIDTSKCGATKTCHLQYPPYLALLRPL